MPKKKAAAKKTIASVRHNAASRKNIPTAEYQSVMREEEKSPIRVAYERRNRDLDPQLVWRGKDEQDWSDLVVHVPPLYIQEKVHPKVLIDDLQRMTEAGRKAGEHQTDLFADFNGLPDDAARTEFYRHDANWSNRMILGDSLQVMASLAEREGLRGKVQCIYIDPPYGIKFNSNFQWSTNSRDVKDGKIDHITREPEQVKAFRDTWRDGIHSYMTYLRDRLTVARDLLTESGSIFVQIGDENVHRIQCLMDEIFGQENRITQICLEKTQGSTTTHLPTVTDFIIWYVKNKTNSKFRELFMDKTIGSAGATGYIYGLSKRDFSIRSFNPQELSNFTEYIDDYTLFDGTPLVSESGGERSRFSVKHHGEMYTPKSNFWKTNETGFKRLEEATRLVNLGNRLEYIRHYDDYPVYPMNNIWTGLGERGFVGKRIYVVQTAAKVLERCILMTTDPGDLVLDPTCGSGTSAYVAEQWGRRWITIDTSRVALALARARIMGARYPYYLLSDSREGQMKEAEVTRTEPSTQPVHGDIRQGFVYERVPHVTLKSIANNTEIDVIYEKYQPQLEDLRSQLNAELSQGGSKKSKIQNPNSQFEEWEIPREADPHWPDKTRQLHADWWKLRIARQQEIDKSIAAKAESEYLYDKPYEDKKTVRVAGPFTVESIAPHRVLAVGVDDEMIDGVGEQRDGYGEAHSFVRMILENLKTSGVQQAHKEDRIAFTSLIPWPGDLICAEGRYMEGAKETGKQKRAAIFIGPEFGTVSRPDLVEAAREAGDAGFDVLIACAFNYDAHSSEFEKLGRIPVLKARMNADLHMAADLKNTGKGNLFVIFGEPDVVVVSGQWLVTSKGRMVDNYERVKMLSGLGSLEEINRLGGADLSRFKQISNGGEIRSDESDTQGGGVSSSQHRGGRGTERDGGVSAISERGRRIAGGSGDVSDSDGTAGDSRSGNHTGTARSGGRDQQNARWAQTIAALQDLKPADFPLSLTTSHYSQVTILGVDVFHPSTGEVRSDGPDGIACWFIDTDYNEESFFVRHAYFLGANDPYKSLKTTLKAEINQEAWDSLRNDTSRPFEKPKSGRIAVKVINHLGDEVMKVYKVV